MSKPVIGTLFSGGGVCLATVKDRFDIAFGVEYDPAIAEVYRANISPNIWIGDILGMNPFDFPYVEFLQISPPCTRASQANANKGETALDITLAHKSCEFITIIQPKVVIVENVRGYGKFKSFEIIVRCLVDNGYTVDIDIQYDMSGNMIFPKLPILNSADYGVPQTRERLILRAVKDRPMPYLPDATPWQGWYSAIEDLIPTLPDDKFADWQLERMPNDLLETSLIDSMQTIRDATVIGWDRPSFTVKANQMRRPISTPKAFLVDSQNAGREITLPQSDLPTWTLSANMGQKGVPKAFLVDGNNANSTSGVATVRYGSDPAPTVKADSGKGVSRAFLVSQEYGNSNISNERVLLKRESDEPSFTIQASETKSKYVRAWLSQGRVARMTPRALARFQSLPDSYQLPDKASLACTVIGNGWPSEMARRIIEPLVFGK